jgi:carbon monoxide dehydrogenase subunit G
VPGARLTEKIDERQYKGEVAMKFGPVQAKYNGEVSIEQLDEANYHMVLKGRGLDAKGKGSADMVMNGKLVEKDGGAEVQSSMEISISGMLAQFGSRLITDVSNQVVNQFIDNFKRQLSGQTSDAPATKQSLDAASLMGSVIKSKVSGLFGGKKEE